MPLGLYPRYFSPDRQYPQDRLDAYVEAREKARKAFLRRLTPLVLGGLAADSILFFLVSDSPWKFILPPLCFFFCAWAGCALTISTRKELRVKQAALGCTRRDLRVAFRNQKIHNLLGWRRLKDADAIGKTVRLLPRLRLYALLEALQRDRESTFQEQNDRMSAARSWIELQWAFSSAWEHERNLRLREAAAAALGKTRCRPAVDALLDSLRLDSFASVRRAAADSLGRIGRPAALDGLQNAQENDPDPRVRGAAADSIQKLSRRH